MILVLLLVSLALFVLGLLFLDDYGEGPSLVLVVTGAIGFLSSLIAIVVLLIRVSNLSVIDQKIEMYEQENARIEEQISDIVTQYQEYETGIFTEIAPESSVTLVSLYPDLKSDTLVQKQIEIYLANHDKIKALKKKEISGSVLRWWLYFGKRR